MFQESKELTVTTAPRTGKWHELAEAIREGCMIAPIQCFYRYTTADNNACAMQAAYRSGYHGDIPAWRTTPCPVCVGKQVEKDLIPHLNDDHRWTRERIADYLDTL